MTIKWIGANKNNYGIGRLSNKIDKIILHWIVGTLESCDATFQSPTRLASSHYGVGDSEVHQYVKEEDTAWHCGNLIVNRQSIGIENEGGPTIPISDETYKTLATLVKDLTARYQIPVDRQHILGHKEVSLKPTECPGALDIDRVITLVKEGGSMTEAEQIRILNEKIGLLESNAQLFTEKVKKYEGELAESKKLLKEWQTTTESAKEQLVIATEQLGIKTTESSKYRKLYEGYNDMSGWSLILMGISKLKVKK